jgi:hypothetical protein
MAEALATSLRIMADPTAAIEATEFLKLHEARIWRNEVLRERLQDLMEHNQMFIMMPAPGKPLHFIIEPSYPLIEIMAEVGR